jgi:hypothetical protein
MKIPFKNFSSDHLLFSPSIRMDLDSRLMTPDEKLKSAEYTVKIHLISTLKNDPFGSDIFNKLIKRGYSQSEIITAIAHGWILNEGFFELADLNRNIFDGFMMKNIVLPMSITIFALMVIAYFAHRMHSVVFIDILAFPPMVGFLGLILFVIVSLVIKKIK